MVNKWVLDDPVTDDSYTFLLNPKEGASPVTRRALTADRTTGGTVTITETRAPAKRLDFSGRIMQQSQYEAFEEWMEKSNVIKITDDLLREFYVMLESFEPRRLLKANHFWAHDYSIQSIIIRQVV